jgi:hypothetical protein
LLHRHLAHWHPISTAPYNQDLEIRALSENGSVAIPFPCRRTNASDWINTDLGTRVYMRPVRWLPQNSSLRREGGPVEQIRPGDVVWFPPGEKHWHGATPTTAMTHIAIAEALDGKVVDWMEHVNDAQYRA